MQQTINLQRNIMLKKKSTFSKAIPVLLFLSFIWLNFYSTMTNVNTINFNVGHFGNLPVYLLIDVLMVAVIDYLVFELLFFVYRFILGFSIYSFMIPKPVLKDKFRFWYFVRNLVLGFVYNVRFFFPVFTTYLCVFELIMNFIFIICFYFDLSVEYVEPLVGQFVFKTLAVPVVLYEVYSVIVLLVGVL